MWIRSAVTSAPEGYLVEVVGITFTTQFNQFVPQSIQFGVVYADDRWKIVSYAAGPAAPNSDPTLDWSVAELRPELEGEGWREIL